MGYTHYWYYNRALTNDEWAAVTKGFSMITNRLPDILLANADGTGNPDITTDQLIFNGGSHNTSEPFELFRTLEAWAKWLGVANGRPWRGFCKTNRQPYDLAVMMILLVVTEVAPGALSVESDEKMDGPGWTKAREMLRVINDSG